MVAARRASGLAALLCASLVFAQDTSRLGKLVVTDAYARPTPPGISVGAIYFSIANEGDTGDRLLAVDTPAAREVQFHETRTVHGVMEMREMAAVDCPARQTIRATPGGLHVMLLGLTAPLAAGTPISVVLHFRDAGVLTLKVPVS